MNKKLKDILTPDKIFTLQESRIYLQEIIAIYYDLRPLLRTGISPWKFKLFKETLLELGFKLLIMESYGPNKNNPTCLIGKSEKKLKEYSDFEKEYIKKSGLVDASSIGKLLGYPRCCVEEFTKNLSNGKSGNHPTKTLSNTKGRLDFRLNFLYNFDTRRFDYKEFKSFFESYHLVKNCLIPHIPCSFNCKESIKYAQKIINILKRDFPEYYKELISFLKKPILFYSDFIFFPLNGKMEGDTFRYKDFIKICDRLPVETIKILNKGNLIKRKNGHLQIYNNDQCIMDKLPPNVKLFNFE